MEEGALVDLPKEGETLRNDVGAWSTQVVAAPRPKRQRGAANAMQGRREATHHGPSV